MGSTDECTTACVTQEYSSFEFEYIRKLYPCVLSAIIQFLFSSFSISRSAAEFFDDSRDLAVKQAILYAAASNDVDACKKAGLQTWKIVGLSRLKSLKQKK